MDSPSYFRNLTYVFRAEVYPREQPIALRDGRFEDPGPFDEGVIDWTIELEAQTGIRLGDERAVILTFFANHEGGSGSASHILVVRCADGRLQIVFEAGGEGVRVSLAGTDALLVSHPVWRASDSHAAPSRIVDEQYSWRAGPGRFVLAGRYERASGIR